MALNHSPQVVTNGLVFYYDMNNTKKSNLGDTTTNLISNGDFSNGLTNWSNYALATAPFLTTVYDFPTALNQQKRVVQCNTLGSIHGGGNYGGIFYNPFPTLTTGITYTLSGYIRSTSGPMTITFSNQNGGGDNSNLAFTRTNIGPNWTRVQNTVSLDLQKNTLYIWNQNVPNGVFQLADVQVEAKSTATAFTSSSRSNVQSIVDLTGRNTITANSITYSDANTFSFNGSSNYFTVIPPSAFDLYSLEFWMYNNNAVPNNDGSIGGPSLYQSPINFNGGPTNGVNLGGWTSAATNEAFHIWSATPGGVMTYNRDAAAVGWHHVVFNWNGSTYDIWLDGVKTTTYAHSSGHAKLANITSLRIGGDIYSGYYFNGRLPIVKCYNVQLTDTQVLQNFNALRGRFGI